MNIIFEKLDEKHQRGVMEIFNYYIENSTAAFPAHVLPEQFYKRFMKKVEGYPAYAIIDTDDAACIGFCQLSAYSPLETFKEVACLTYFIAKEYTGKGIGAMCLTKLEEEAKYRGIRHLLAEISSENLGSIAFHQKHGFKVVGQLNNIGKKFDCNFSIIYMQKSVE